MEVKYNDMKYLDSLINGVIEFCNKYDFEYSLTPKSSINNFVKNTYKFLRENERLIFVNAKKDIEDSLEETENKKLSKVWISVCYGFNKYEYNNYKPMVSKDFNYNNGGSACSVELGTEINVEEDIKRFMKSFGIYNEKDFESLNKNKEITLFDFM